MRAERPAPAASLREVSRHRVRQFLTDWAVLDGLAPQTYPRIITRGDGVYLYDDRGTRLFDAGHHIGACNVGHGRAELAGRIAAQVATLEYSSLDAGISHVPVAELALALAPLLPLEDPAFNFTSSGSEAMEAALKTARAYHAARGEPERVKFLVREGSYHGSSYGAVTATWNPIFHEGFGPLLPGFVRVPQPSPGRCGHCDPQEGCTLACATELERVVEREGPGTIAAFVGEPVGIQQAVKVPHPDYWRTVRELCDRHGILLIADEVVTGFGRTGRWFGIEHWDVAPDIVVLAKGITSGYVPLGAAAYARHVEDAFAERPMAHVNTYAGHPVACAAALGVLELLASERLVERAAQAERVIRGELAALAQRFPEVVGGAAIGCLGHVELRVDDARSGAATIARVRHAAYERGLLVRGAAGATSAVFYFYPPLIATDDEIRAAFATLAEAWAHVNEEEGR